MQDHIKNFRQFINESDQYLGSDNAAIFEDPMSYRDRDEAWAGDNLADWLAASEDDGPGPGPEPDVEAAVDAICADCRLHPREVRIHGVLTYDAELAIDNLMKDSAQHIETLGGYPGAPWIDKYTIGDTVYYTAGMYDGTIVASCDRERPLQRRRSR